MQARNDIVMVRRLDGDEKSKGGIVFANPEKQSIAEVVSVGPKVESVKAGERILIADFQGKDIRHGGETLIALHDDELIAVVE